MNLPPSDGVDEREARLHALVYELLDAHGDTQRLAGDRPHDLAWALHLDYLRDLQRVGRELLATGGVSSDERASVPRSVRSSERGRR
jgi:hypothetical protein